ncbi:MAG: hypothetical protein M3P39_04270 [Actinomycetota bacterium]|nr:hypothetical protein [Actinomycetota bacterium]
MILFIPFLFVALVALLVVAVLIGLAVWALCAAASRADRELARGHERDHAITVRRVRRRSAGG